VFFPFFFFEELFPSPPIPLIATLLPSFPRTCLKHLFLFYTRPPETPAPRRFLVSSFNLLSSGPLQLVSSPLVHIFRLVLLSSHTGFEIFPCGNRFLPSLVMIFMVSRPVSLYSSSSSSPHLVSSMLWPVSYVAHSFLHEIDLLFGCYLVFFNPVPPRRAQLSAVSGCFSLLSVSCTQFCPLSPSRLLLSFFVLVSSIQGMPSHCVR